VWKKGKHNYISAFEIMKFDDCYIELYEAYPCNNKNELFKREGEVIRELKHECVNIAVAGQTRVDYRKSIKAHKTQYDKEYLKTNRSQIYQKNSAYRESHKAEISARDKAYREKNAAELKKKIPCACGCPYSKATKWYHQKSQKHQAHAQTRNLMIKYFGFDPEPYLLKSL